MFVYLDVGVEEKIEPSLSAPTQSAAMPSQIQDIISGAYFNFIYVTYYTQTSNECKGPTII